MKQHNPSFLDFCLKHHILQWGHFKLKSGRMSPYFFNSGLFSEGAFLAELGQFYADCIQKSAIQYDMLFGPAYKGIPIVCATSIALAQSHQTNKPYCFNRKELKAYGEKGMWIGGPPKGRILLLDDVLTAGIAIREAMHLLNDCPVEIVGILIAFDREEPSQHQAQSTRETLEQTYQIPVLSLLRFHELITHLKESNALDHVQKMQDYARDLRQRAQ